MARHVLKRLTENGDPVGTLTSAFNCDGKFVSSIVSFLEDIGWMKQQPSGQYVIADRGRGGQLF
ncbi:MAG TPA: hypothetical protein VFR94_14640 [Nitrososphaeraceae archaeon]|nr:hypothetical protein [Nitrososphaeraceae archaeon]